MSLNTNIDALEAYRNLAGVQRGLSVSIERLSSGLRINSAADDAAGLTLTQGLQIQVNGIGQSIRNIQDAINLVQTAEGGLGQVSDVLQQMNVLAVQAANASYDDASRESLQNEMTELEGHIDSISGNTAYNDTQLLDGTFQNQSFQIGYRPPDTLIFTITSMDGTAKGFNATDLGVTSVDVSVQTNAVSSIDTIKTAIDNVATARASLGAVQNRLTHTLAVQQVTQENLQASTSSIQDADIATETASFARSTVLSDAGTAMLAQANSDQKAILSLIDGGLIDTKKGSIKTLGTGYDTSSSSTSSPTTAGASSTSTSTTSIAI